MHATINDWKNGWVGLELAVAPDRLVTLLQALKADPTQHFHIASDYKDTGGVGDIEVFVKAQDQPHNLHLSGFALPPGSER